MLGEKNIGPFVGVHHDEVVTFKNGRSFRVITYQAYSAFGLIGPESNGIAIFDEDEMEVIVDEIAKETSGYFGISPAQARQWRVLTCMTWAAFQAFVNRQVTRLRHPI